MELYERFMICNAILDIENILDAHKQLFLQKNHKQCDVTEINDKIQKYRDVGEYILSVKSDHLFALISTEEILNRLYTLL